MASALMIDVAISQGRRRETGVRRPPRLVELVGPAGAGKTTLAATLPKRDPTIRQAPNLWGLPRHFLAAGTMELLPVFAAGAAHGRRFGSSEMGQMVRIVALRRAVDRAAARAHGTLVVDEGAVFGLTWLEVFHEAPDDTVRNAWRARERERWSRRLDAVIRLDADDDELARRIRTRDKQHMVKDRSDAEIRAFMLRFRSCYDRIIDAIVAEGRVAVRTMTTGGDSIFDRSARLRETIGEALRAR
jgi:hypothetical protein